MQIQVSFTKISSRRQLTAPQLGGIDWSMAAKMVSKWFTLQLNVWEVSSSKNVFLGFVMMTRVCSWRANIMDLVVYFCILVKDGWMCINMKSLSLWLRLKILIQWQEVSVVRMADIIWFNNNNCVYHCFLVFSVRVKEHLLNYSSPNTTWNKYFRVLLWKCCFS